MRNISNIGFMLKTCMSLFANICRNVFVYISTFLCYNKINFFNSFKFSVFFCNVRFEFIVFSKICKLKKKVI